MAKWLNKLNLGLASALAALLISADADSGNSDSGGSDSGNSGSGAESSAESGVETSSNSLTYGDTTMSIALSNSSSGREPIQRTAKVSKQGEHTDGLTGDDLREIPPSQ